MTDFENDIRNRVEDCCFSQILYLLDTYPEKANEIKEVIYEVINDIFEIEKEAGVI